jgi:hypothetical protein
LAATEPLRSSASSAVRIFTAEAAEVRRRSCQKSKKLQLCYAERRNSVSANQRFLLVVKVAQGRMTITSLGRLAEVLRVGVLEIA